MAGKPRIARGTTATMGVGAAVAVAEWPVALGLVAVAVVVILAICWILGDEGRSDRLSRILKALLGVSRS